MCRVFINLQVKKIEGILALMIKLINKLSYKISQASLLMHPDYAILKGFDTAIDA